MGGRGSGRVSVKLSAIECVLEIQSLLLNLLYKDLDSSMSRDELKTKVEEYYRKTKVVQEEIERIKIK